MIWRNIQVARKDSKYNENPKSRFGTFKKNV